MKFSMTTLIGIVAAVGLCLFAIATNTDNYVMFWSMSSLAMVGGGTLAASFIAYQERYVIRALKEVLNILVPAAVSPKSLFADVERLISWANVIRSEGMSGAEKSLAEDAGKDTFLARGLRLLLTNYRADKLRAMLNNMLNSEYGRTNVQVDILNNMGSVSPAFGMVGTLVGLVIMLEKMSGDVSQLGIGMAVAMLTTLYGVLFAQIIFKPAALKLQQKNEMLRFRNQLLVEGLVLLSEGANPGQIEDALNSFLDPKLYFDIADRPDSDGEDE